MLNGVWSKLTAPRTRYEAGNIHNPKEAAAAAKVADLEGLVKHIGVSMSQLDETAGDKNQGTKGNVYGSINGKSFSGTGSCQLGTDGQVQSLDVKGGWLGSSDRVTVKTSGDHKEIHKVHMFEGSPCIEDMGPSTLEEHQWAIFDGKQVTYKEYSFFSDATP